MAKWDTGYVSNINYTSGYYAELNPIQGNLARLLKGYRVTGAKNACELGFGNGLSAIIHSAASSARWYGNDFNPSQASLAAEIVEDAGCDANLCDDSFEEYLSRKDLPKFEFIGLHGIWSWVSRQNQKLVIQFIKKNLAVGGTLYISYNTLPGWSQFSPIRELMMERLRTGGYSEGDIKERVENAFSFAKEIIDAGSVYSNSNPTVKKQIDEFSSQSIQYLAHEFFNKDWSPVHFKTLALDMERAKLTYAAPAHLGEHIDHLNFTHEQRQTLAGIKDKYLNESVRDFFLNQTFRRDYWIKGPNRLTSQEQLDLFRSLRISFLSHKEDVQLNFTGPLGVINLLQKVYEPLLDVLSENHVIDVRTVEKKVEKLGIDLAQLFEALTILSAKGYVRPVQNEHEIDLAISKTKKLNRTLLQKSKYSSEVKFLASPLTGGGLQVSRFTQLFMLAKQQGAKTPEEFSRFAWECLRKENSKLIKDGKSLNTEEENLDELQTQATSFRDKMIPLLERALIL